MSSSSQEPEWTEPAGPVAAASDVASLLILADPKMKYVDRGEAYRPNRPVSFNPGRAERRLGLLCFLSCTFRHFRFLRLPQLEDSQRRRPINTSRAADNCGRKLQFAVSTLEPRFFIFIFLVHHIGAGSCMRIITCKAEQQWPSSSSSTAATSSVQRLRMR